MKSAQLHKFIIIDSLTPPLVVIPSTMTFPHYSSNDIFISNFQPKTYQHEPGRQQPHSGCCKCCRPPSERSHRGQLEFLSGLRFERWCAYNLRSRTKVPNYFRKYFMWNYMYIWFLSLKHNYTFLTKENRFCGNWFLSDIINLLYGYFR